MWFQLEKIPDQAALACGVIIELHPMIMVVVHVMQVL